ncbi:MAG: MotA/TolQ/ExbB proton channel family protein [Isosphaeraceae bacterium]
MRTGDREMRALTRAYRGTLAMLVLAAAFPVALMIFNPTLMFERGWEQYAGTSIYFWAVLTLGRELYRLWSDEKAFAQAPALLDRLAKRAANGDRAGTERLTDVIPADETRVLPARIRQLAAYLEESRRPSVGQLMEINREGSALDQEQASGRFTLTRYILYLLPVIGFIGTVEGISHALMNISKVLPMVKELDGFMSNLTGVTSALQIAFDSTLLALFLSAALMLVQTLVFRRAEDLLARVDRWVVEHVLNRFGSDDAVGVAGSGDSASAELERLRRDLAVVLQQFGATVERLPASLSGFQRGAEAIGRIGGDLEALGTASDSLRRGVVSLSRIETSIEGMTSPSEVLSEIRRGIDRNNAAVEALANSLAHAYEKSNRASQEQLARTLHSLKDALDLLHVSMEQGNALYRNIVKKLFHSETKLFPHQEDAA